MDKMRVAVSQMKPVWLNKKETLDKVLREIEKAAKQDCKLIAFPEALVPGYPFWVERTNGAVFNSDVQKDYYARYMKEAFHFPSGDTDAVSKLAKELDISIYLGVIERAADRGNHSLYCSLVFVNQQGEVKSVHRKLMPTYEERLVWSIGDGNGLVTHDMGDFRVGGLNCWENWMPMARASLYGQGENVHVMVWPGSMHNTEVITRFVARESRSYVLSASSPMTKADVPEDVPHYDVLMQSEGDVFTNGGSCIAGPDGEWLAEPVKDKEVLITVEIDHEMIRKERQNFDPSGHYARPDVFTLHVNRERQSMIKLSDQ
jgi:nitrilase